jgi:hypothetical protein
MADQIEVQGESVIITTQTTVSKEGYLIQRQYELANLQNQERVIEAEIARIQAVIDQLVQGE